MKLWKQGKRPFKILLVLLVLVGQSFWSPQELGAGDEVNNGGGAGQQTVTYAYLNLKDYLTICLHSMKCSLSAHERIILEKIRESLPREYANPTQLVFLSEKKNPSFFKIDGEIKLAKTGSKVGDPIYFNLDLISPNSPQAGGDGEEGDEEEEVGISLSAAVAALIHELGHHQQIKDHAQLDLMGQKVASVLQHFITRISPFPRHQRVFLLNLSAKRPRAFSTLLLYVGQEIIDLSPLFKQSLTCPQDAQVPVVGATAFNLYYPEVKKEGNIWSFTLEGNVSILCQGWRRRFVLNSLSREDKFRLHFEVKRNLTLRGRPIQWKVLRESIALKQIRQN